MIQEVATLLNICFGSKGIKQPTFEMKKRDLHLLQNVLRTFGQLQCKIKWFGMNQDRISCFYGLISDKWE